MGTQAQLPFTTAADLERFNIPRSCDDIRYGHVSRHLYYLWKYGQREEAAELAKVAAKVFNAPYWAKRYPPPSHGSQDIQNDAHTTWQVHRQILHSPTHPLGNPHEIAT